MKESEEIIVRGTAGWYEIIKEIQDRIIALFEEQERCFAIYRSWWPDMLTEYKENCLRSDGYPQWLLEKQNLPAPGEKTKGKTGLPVRGKKKTDKMKP